MGKAFIIGGSGHARVIASMLSVEPQFVDPDRASENRVLAELVADHAGAEFYVGIGINAGRRRVAPDACSHAYRPMPIRIQTCPHLPNPGRKPSVWPPARTTTNPVTTVTGFVVARQARQVKHKWLGFQVLVDPFSPAPK